MTIAPVLLLLAALALSAGDAAPAAPTSPSSEGVSDKDGEDGATHTPETKERRPATPQGPFAAVEEVPGLKDGERVLRASRGPFGPSDDCVLAVTSRGANDAFHARLDCGTETWSIGPLTDWAGWELDELWMRDLDGDGYVEAVVMGRYVTGIGPEGVVPFPVTSVLRWDGRTLTRDAAAEAKVDAARTPAEVKKKLAP
jgi:hypothetical protein